MSVIYVDNLSQYNEQTETLKRGIVSTIES